MPFSIKKNICSFAHGRAIFSLNEMSKLNQQDFNEFSEELIKAAQEGMHIAFDDISSKDKTKLNSWIPDPESASNGITGISQNESLICMLPLIKELRIHGFNIKDQKEYEIIDDQGNIRPILLLGGKNNKRKFTIMTVKDLKTEAEASSSNFSEILTKEYKYLIGQYNQEIASIRNGIKIKFSENILIEMTRLKSGIHKNLNPNEKETLEMLADAHWRMGMICSINDGDAKQAVNFLMISVGFYRELMINSPSEVEKLSKYINEIEDDIRAISEIYLNVNDASDDVLNDKACDVIEYVGVNNNNNNNNNNTNANISEVIRETINTDSSAGAGRTLSAQKLHTKIMRILVGKLKCASESEVIIFLKNTIEHDDNLTERSVNGFSILDDIAHIGPNSIRQRKITLNTLDNLFNAVVKLLNDSQKRDLAKNKNINGLTLMHHAATSGNYFIYEKVIEFYSKVMEKEDVFKHMALATKQGFNILHFSQSYFNERQAHDVIQSIINYYNMTKDFATLSSIFTQRTILENCAGFLPTSFNRKRAAENHMCPKDIESYVAILKGAENWFNNERIKES